MKTVLTDNLKLFVYFDLIFIPQDDAKEEEISNNRRYIPPVWSSPQIIRKLTPTFRRKLKPAAAQWNDNNRSCEQSFLIRWCLTWAASLAEEHIPLFVKQDQLHYRCDWNCDNFVNSVCLVSQSSQDQQVYRFKFKTSGINHES